MELSSRLRLTEVRQCISSVKTGTYEFVSHQFSLSLLDALANFYSENKLLVVIHIPDVQNSEVPIQGTDPKRCFDITDCNIKITSTADKNPF